MNPFLKTVFSLLAFLTVSTSGNAGPKEIPKLPSWAQLAVAHENTRREKLLAEPAEYLNGFYPNRDIGDALSAWINCFHAKFLYPALGKTFHKEKVRYTGQVYSEKERSASLDFRKKTLRTKFGIFEKLSLPEGSKVHLDGYGNDFIKTAETPIPIIRQAYYFMAKSPCEERTLEFINNQFFTERSDSLKIYLQFGFTPHSQSKISGFGIQTFDDEIHIFSGSPATEDIALCALEKILSSNEIPRNTIFLCALPETNKP